MADPPIRIVSEQSDADIEKNRTKEEVGIVLRAVAANLLRVIRGAGKPYDLSREMRGCLQAFKAYYDAHDQWPDSFRLQKEVDFDSGEYSRLRSDMTDREMEQWEIERAENEICRAALQIVASKLIDQPLQERRGNDDLYSAIRSLEESRAKRRARYAAEAKPVKPQKRNKKPPGGKPGGIVL